MQQHGKFGYIFLFNVLICCDGNIKEIFEDRRKKILALLPFSQPIDLEKKNQFCTILL